MFLSFGYIKHTVFDKAKNLLIIYKRNLCWHKKSKHYRMSDITEIKAVERGYERGAVNTRHYKICIEFVNQSPLTILETHNSQRVKKEVSNRSNVCKLLLIYKFLGLEDEEIKIHDQLTRFPEDEESEGEEEEKKTEETKASTKEDQTKDS